MKRNILVILVVFLSSCSAGRVSDLDKVNEEYVMMIKQIRVDLAEAYVEGEKDVQLTGTLSLAIVLAEMSIKNTINDKVKLELKGIREELLDYQKENIKNYRDNTNVK